MDAKPKHTHLTDKRDSWSLPCGEAAKQGLMVILVACFVIQTCLVYFDPSASPRLTAIAREGLEIWRGHNCQSCHQLYGFGGFLGPDLTNAAERLTPPQLKHLLTVGSRQMPAFQMSPAEIVAISVFLSEVNETGRGQARFRSESPGARRWRVMATLMEEENYDRAKSGYHLFIRRGCQGCHLQVSPTTTPAPDLMDVCDRLERAEIMSVLEHGRMPKMPVPQLSPEGRIEIYAFLSWLGEGRHALDDAFKETDESHDIVWSEVPWWEYK